MADMFELPSYGGSITSFAPPCFMHRIVVFGDQAKCRVKDPPKPASMFTPQALRRDHREERRHRREKTGRFLAGRFEKVSSDINIGARGGHLEDFSNAVESGRFLSLLPAG